MFLYSLDKLTSIYNYKGDDLDGKIIKRTLSWLVTVMSQGSQQWIVSPPVARVLKVCHSHFGVSIRV